MNPFIDWFVSSLRALENEYDQIIGYKYKWVEPTGGSGYAEHYNWLDNNEKEVIQQWIRCHVRCASPSLFNNVPITSHALKKPFLDSGGFYMSAGDMTGALEAAGFNPVGCDGISWYFEIELFDID